MRAAQIWHLLSPTGKTNYINKKRKNIIQSRWRLQIGNYMLLPPQVITRPTLQLHMRDSGCLCGPMLCLNMTSLYGKYVFICQGSLCGMVATHLLPPLVLLLLQQHHVLQECDPNTPSPPSLLGCNFKSEGTLHHQGCSCCCCTQNRTRSAAVAHMTLTFLTDLSVGTAVNAAEGISPTFMFTSLLFLLTVSAEYFSATFSVSLTYLVACLTSALQSTTESLMASRW